ncbi:hypothetical protein HYX10_00985 [Candidatus Woesearchaeota archaeon]|nr:hypothetical protein [Candidatus Woesearchaeota archaeon]
MPGIDFLNEPISLEPRMVALEFDLQFPPSEIAKGMKQYVTEILGGASDEDALKALYDERRRTLAARAGQYRSIVESRLRTGDLSLFVTMFYEEGPMLHAQRKIASICYYKASGVIPTADHEMLMALSRDTAEIIEVLWRVRHRLDLSTGLGPAIFPSPEARRAAPENMPHSPVPDSVAKIFGQYL